MPIEWRMVYEASTVQNSDAVENRRFYKINVVRIYCFRISSSLDSNSIVVAHRSEQSTSFESLLKDKEHTDPMFALHNAVNVC